MKFIFWQNIVSPHMSFFLRDLSKVQTVVLVVENLMDADRLQQGWEIPNLGNTEIIVVKDIKKLVNSFNEQSECHHFFSGINSYPLLYEAFKLIIKKQKVNVIAESAIQLGFKSKIRFIKYKYLALLYNNNIENIFAMGDLGVDWYRKSGFSPDKIHRFQYTIELPEAADLHFQEFEKEENCCRFTFIGQLINRKGIDNLLNALSKVKNQDWHLNIIGDGILHTEISEMIKSLKLNDKITLCGVKSNREAMLFLSNHTDYLILPSRFDGWGAVVNEALARGVKVITNEKCGASCMIENNFWGRIYKEGDKKKLTETIETVIVANKITPAAQRAQLSFDYTVQHQKNVLHNFITYFI